MGQNTPLLPLNSALFDASDFGGESCMIQQVLAASALPTCTVHAHTSNTSHAPQ